MKLLAPPPKAKEFYRLLGVDENCSYDTVQQAWRRLSKQLHPDLHPERYEEFLKAKRAYEVLSSPNLREEYDETSEDPGLPSGLEVKANKLLRGMIGQMLDNMQSDEENLVDALRELLISQMLSMQNNIGNAERALAKVHKQKAAVTKRWKGAPDLLTMAVQHMDDKIQTYDGQLADARIQIQVVSIAQKLLNDASYEPLYQDARYAWGRQQENVYSHHVQMPANPRYGDVDFTKLIK